MFNNCFFNFCIPKQLRKSCAKLLGFTNDFSCRFEIRNATTALCALSCSFARLAPLRQKQKPAANATGFKFTIGRLNLRQTNATFGATARDNRAASGRRHPGAKTEFAGAGAFFGLPSAFHNFSPRSEPTVGVPSGLTLAISEKRPQYSRRCAPCKPVETLLLAS